MRNTLEDLYYGNITPNAQDMAPNSELKRATDRVTRFEKQLTEQLDEAGQATLAKLIESQQEIDSITAMENFILGFRLPVTKNVLAKTKSECAAKLKVLQDSIQAPTSDQPKPGILLADWLDFWYQSYKKPNLRPNTQMSYERRIYQHIIPALGNTQLNKLTANDIQQFYTKLKQSGRLLRAEIYGEGLSDQTVRGIHTTLHTALDKAVSEQLLFRNPADGCRLPPAKAREMQVLTPEEIQRLLIQAKEDGCFELLLLELSTGLRRGEICALQWNDLNFRTGELRVERQVHRVRGELVVSPPKTKAGNRSLILPAPVLGVLKKYREIVNSTA